MLLLVYLITQEESFKLREVIPNISIKICSKRKKGRGSKTYYCEEGQHVRLALERIRNEKVGI